MRIPQHPIDRDPADPSRPWAGNCVLHGNCWEGLGSGPALAVRNRCWADAGLDPPDTDLLASEYLALGTTNLIATYRPQRVVIGGGVASEGSRLARARPRVGELLDERYFPEAADLDDLVVTPRLGDAAGVAGAFLMGRKPDVPTREPLFLNSLVEAVSGALRSGGFR